MATEVQVQITLSACSDSWKILVIAMFNIRQPWVAAIAPWFCLRLPSCGPGFESQAHHLCFFNLYYWNCNEKIMKINKKEAGIGPFLKYRAAWLMMLCGHHTLTCPIYCMFVWERWDEQELMVEWWLTTGAFLQQLNTINLTDRTFDLGPNLWRHFSVNLRYASSDWMLNFVDQ